MAISYTEILHSFNLKVKVSHVRGNSDANAKYIEPSSVYGLQFNQSGNGIVKVAQPISCTL